jgi:effector-binding domain-containing protein/DNA-binding transcriptional MerR regulator
MFKIGEFSRLNKISIKTLRYYDKIGLLKPMDVQTDTGYRYYSAKQLPRFNKIVALKDLGFSLNDIMEIVENDLTIETIMSMLNLRKEEIEDTVKTEQEKLRKIRSMMDKMKNEEDSVMLKYNVIIKEVEPLKVASLRDIIPTYSEQGHLWEELVTHLNKNNVKIAPPCIVIYHDAGFKGSDVDAEIAEHIVGNAPETDRIKVKNLDPVKEMACVVHKGAYEYLSEAYGVIQKWIEENGYKVIGANRELYLEGEWSTNSPEEYITEIQIPVEKM